MVPTKLYGMLVVWHVSSVQELLLALFICVCHLETQQAWS